MRRGRSRVVESRWNELYAALLSERLGEVFEELDVRLGEADGAVEEVAGLVN